MAATVKYTDAHRSTEPASADAFAAKSHEPCPLFWPEQDQHAVRYVSLETTVPAHIAAIVPQLRELAAIGNALRALQTRDGSILSEPAADALAERSGEILLEVADVVGGESATIARMRAAAFLEGASHRDASVREAECYDSQPLTLLCGPMCTWRLKTRTPLHTVVAAVACKRYDDIVQALDAHLEEGAGDLREMLQLGELKLHSSYPMRVTDMIACGGEANAYPKHFAYFLPEDESIRDEPGQSKKTTAFRNAYRDRYEVISRPLGEALLRGPVDGPVGPAEGPLLVWFRGHDIGHTASLPTTDYGWRLDLGHEPFMMMQEVLADVYGYLLALTPSWLEQSGDSPTDIAVVFLGELLHYLRRHPRLYGDAGAAYLELSFLAVNGYVDIDEAGHISWETERLREGMIALGKALAETVLAPTTDGPCKELIAQYGWPTITPAAKVVEVLQGELRTVATALAYRDGPVQSEDAGAEPGDVASAQAS